MIRCKGQNVTIHLAIAAYLTSCSVIEYKSIECRLLKKTELLIKRIPDT